MISTHVYRLRYAAALSAIIMLSGCSAVSTLTDALPEPVQPSKNSSLQAISPSSAYKDTERTSLLDYFNEQPDKIEPADADSSGQAKQDVSADEGNFTLQSLFSGLIEDIESPNKSESHNDRLNKLPVIGK